MPKLPPAVLSEQRQMLADIERLPSEPSRRQIAQAAGVDNSVVSKWASDGKDGREIKASEKEKLADVFGWDVVYGRALRAGRWAIVPVDGDLVDIEDTADDLSELAVQHRRAVHRASVDRMIDRIEAEELARLRAAMRKVLADQEASTNAATRRAAS